MNLAQLLAHFDRISDAPDAIPRLRRFILDLAVRGKLVEQDPNDEPASELLKRIQAEKARLVQDAKLRRPRALEVNETDDGPFPIPAQWTWCRLSEVGAIVGGGTPSSADADNFTTGGSGIAWLTPADLGKHTSFFVSHGERDLTPQGLRSSSATVMPKGSVLFTSRAPIGYTAIAANEVSTNQGFKSVVPYILECNHYIAAYFRAFGRQIDERASGTTFREVSGKIVANLPFPLPPLAEQHRIVAKVDELMAACDRLEAAQAEREKRRDRLTAASLQRLNNDTDAQSFHECARFHLSHLPRLTTRPAHIQQLRRTILSLAVRGKLVPQDPRDESASELLKRIQAEKARLGKLGEIRKEKLSPPIEEDEAPFRIPLRWSWVRLRDVTSYIQRGKSPKYAIDDGLPVISQKCVQWRGLELESAKLITRESMGEYESNRFLRNGDLLWNSTGTGTIGRIIKVSQPPARLVCDSHVTVVRCLEVDEEYVRSWLRSDYVYGFIEDRATGSTNQVELTLEMATNQIVPLPPLSEQHRIATRVEELMALCDRLEARITTAQTESSRLLESILHHALAPAAV